MNEQQVNKSKISRPEFIEFYNWTKTLSNPSSIPTEEFKKKLESICGKEFTSATIYNAMTDCGIERMASKRESPLANRVEELEITVQRLQDQINRLESMID